MVLTVLYLKYRNLKEMIKVRNPISFRDWLHIASILLIIGAAFLLLEQIPFVDDFLGKFSEYMEVEFGYIH